MNTFSSHGGCIFKNSDHLGIGGIKSLLTDNDLLAYDFTWGRRILHCPANGFYECFATHQSIVAS